MRIDADAPESPHLCVEHHSAHDARVCHGFAQRIQSFLQQVQQPVFKSVRRSRRRCSPQDFVMLPELKELSEMPELSVYFRSVVAPALVHLVVVMRAV